LTGNPLDADPLRLLRPDEMLQRTYLLRSNEWKPIYRRKENMDHVDLKSRAPQSIIFSTTKSVATSGNFDTLDPGDFQSIGTDVETIYARAVSPIGPAELVVTTHWFSDELLSVVAEVDPAMAKTIEIRKRLKEIRDRRLEGGA